MTDLSGKTALVTGASRGIGASTAIALAKAGAHVIIAARTVKDLEAVDDIIQNETGESATIVPLDLTQPEKVDMLGAMLNDRFGKLDILVCNAGMLGDITPLNQTSPKVFDQVIATNLTANFRLIRSMDPLLRQVDNAKVIFLGAPKVTKKPFAYFGAYSASKAGLEIMAQIYRQETRRTNIDIEIFDPGVVNTAMRAKAFPGEDKTQLKKPDQVAEEILALL